MSGTTYTVKPSRRGGVEVLGPGHRRGTHYQDEVTGLAHARKVVGYAGGGEVYVLNSAGKIVSSHTVLSA